MDIYLIQTLLKDGNPSGRLNRNVYLVCPCSVVEVRSSRLVFGTLRKP